MTGPVELADALRAALEALVVGWPIAGVRLVGSDGAVRAEAGDVAAGPARRVPLELSGSPVGHAELFGEVSPVDDEMLQLIALRMAAEQPTHQSTTESTDRDGAERAEPDSDPTRSGEHGPDPS